MPPQFSLQPQFFQPDTVRLDVAVTALPDHFLGTAFDVVFPEGWHFDHHELCGGFSSEDSGIFHLVSSQPDAQRVVFGLVVPGGVPAGIQDGCLVRLYFHLSGFASGRLFFEHTTLSVYQNGRQDVSGVRWEGAFYDASGESPPSAQLSTQEIAGTQSSLSLQTGKADFLAMMDSSLVDVYILLVVTLVLAVAVFFLFLAYFRLRTRD